MYSINGLELFRNAGESILFLTFVLSCPLMSEMLRPFIKDDSKHKKRE